MYKFLLILGAVTTAAGLGLLGSGVIGHEGAFDAEVLTPGTIAAVGGFLLIGMGFGIRELQRIQRALAARPMPRSSRPGEAPAAAAVAEQPNGLARIPFPPKPKAEARPQAAPAATNAAPAAAEDAGFERLREKFPTLVRLENAPMVEETDVSLLPRTPARIEEDVSEGTNGIAGSRPNGSASARVAPRLETNVRRLGPRERPKGSVFDAFWPKGPQVRGTAQTAAQVAESQPLPPPVEPAPASEAVPEAQPLAAEPAPGSAPVSILKSGVVEGMAYTLYSDGSIEAQLPQGTLRFGSITELRDHIENDS